MSILEYVQLSYALKIVNLTAKVFHHQGFIHTTLFHHNSENGIAMKSFSQYAIMFFIDSHECEG